MKKLKIKIILVTTYSQAYFSISPSNYDIGFWMVRERESADDCCYFYVPNWDLFIMFYVPT